ncbi:hypothetical protein [Haloferula sp. BvORR071]|uniref:hypothetical protein n=1 Tax=Haloferula sp. BvORR071 TaxID=1396141 RepID=UPI0022410560|nr:hypothetical protein [Haloferula sp. BvORR071]
MANPRHAAALIPLLWLATLGQASAGMTVITLTDIARARLDALSFFLFAYLFISWLVKLLWNYLGKTFTALPKLNYRRALGLVFLSGMMFYVVLTMISGAREVMTPGAWEKQGIGYRTREGGVAYLGKDERRSALRELQEAIWAYAKQHGGKAPPGPLVEGITPELWQFRGGGLYCLMSDVRPGGGREVLVYEPSTAGGRRFILLADGNIEDRDEGTLKSDLERQFRK